MNQGAFLIAASLVLQHITSITGAPDLTTTEMKLQHIRYTIFPETYRLHIWVSGSQTHYLRLHDLLATGRIVEYGLGELGFDVLAVTEMPWESDSQHPSFSVRIGVTGSPVES